MCLRLLKSELLCRLRRLSQFQILFCRRAEPTAWTAKVLVEAGEYVNRFDFAVYDENGTAVTENYDFVYNFGTLSVLKICIALSEWA